MRRITSYRPSPAMVVAVLALLTATGGVALAAGTSGGAIQGCVQKQNGQLRVVSDPSQCRQNEQPIAWNQQGPPGPAGPQGPQGNPGRPGANGTSIVARARLAGSVTLHPGIGTIRTESVPLTGGTWTQAANELDQFFGAVSLNPGLCSANINVDLDGKSLSFGQEGFAGFLFEPGTPSGHTLTAQAESECSTAQGAQDPPTLTSVDVDVLGAR